MFIIIFFCFFNIRLRRHGDVPNSEIMWKMPNDIDIDTGLEYFHITINGIPVYIVGPRFVILTYPCEFN